MVPIYLAVQYELRLFTIMVLAQLVSAPCVVQVLKLTMASLEPRDHRLESVTYSRRIHYLSK
jgi:hypothetical protein